MFADSRFDYLSQVRFYATVVVTPIQIVADLPSRASQAIASMFKDRSDLEGENTQLREALLMQQYQLQKLDHLVAENQRLNDLLKASSIVEEIVVRAQLTGESPDPYVKKILINKGTTEGVFVGQSVLDASGLMGQVVEVEPLRSWVLLITDPQHSTPVQINRNGLRAIASGTRDSLHMLMLNNIPNTEDVQVGDDLVTSGLGGRFPAGYPVGVISSIIHDPGKPFADVLVIPTAEINRSRNLLLVFEKPVVHSSLLESFTETRSLPAPEPADAAIMQAGEVALPQAASPLQVDPAVPQTDTQLQDNTPEAADGQ